MGRVFLTMTGRVKPNLSLSFPMIQSATSPAILELSLSLHKYYGPFALMATVGIANHCQEPLVASLFLSLPSPLFSTFTILPHPSYLNWVTFGFALTLIVLLMTGKSNKGAHYCKIFKKGPSPA